MRSTRSPFPKPVPEARSRSPFPKPVPEARSRSPFPKPVPKARSESPFRQSTRGPKNPVAKRRLPLLKVDAMKPTCTATLRRSASRIVGLVILLMASPLYGDDRDQQKRAAQAKQDAASTQKGKQALQPLPNQLQGGPQELQQAVESLAQAKAKVRDSKRGVDEARKQVESTQSKLLGYDAAFAKQKSAKEAYEAIKIPLLKSIQTSAAYKQAIEKAGAAQSRLKELRASSDGTDAGRKAELADVARALLAVSDLEQQTLAADANSMSAKDRLTETQQMVAKLHAMVRSAIEGDPAIKSANDSLATANSDVQQAEAMIAGLRQTLAENVNRAAMAQQQAQQAGSRVGSGHARNRLNAINRQNPNNRLNPYGQLYPD